MGNADSDEGVLRTWVLYFEERSIGCVVLCSVVLCCVVGIMRRYIEWCYVMK